MGWITISQICSTSNDTFLRHKSSWMLEALPEFSRAGVTCYTWVIKITSITWLNSTTCEKGLGLLIDHDLPINQQLDVAILLHQQKSHVVLVPLYTVLIKSHLKFCVQSEVLQFRKDVIKLEGIHMQIKEEFAAIIVGVFLGGGTITGCVLRTLFTQAKCRIYFSQ